MTSFTNIFDFLKESSNENNEHLRTLSSRFNISLDTTEEAPSEELIVATINTKIHEKNSRVKGLTLIQYILPKISDTNLLKHGLFWITTSIQILDSVHNNVSEITLTCHILADLLVSCKRKSELHKHISMQNVKQIIIILSNFKDRESCGSIYYLLAVLLYHYSEISERYQNCIMKMILPQIDAHEESLVTAGGNCFALMTKAHERSFTMPKKCINHTNWVYNQVLLCNSLHFIINEIFSDVSEIVSIDKLECNDFELLDLPKISEDNLLEYYNGLERRFINLNIYLSIMLRGCGEKNFVIPTEILHILCRGLAISPFNLKTEDLAKKRILFSMLPRLQMSLLTTLNAFIEGFRQELIPYTDSVLKLIQQTFEWTEKAINEHAYLNEIKSFQHVRLFAYKTLKTWLMYTGSISIMEKFAKYFLLVIIKDIRNLTKTDTTFCIQKADHIPKNVVNNSDPSLYKNKCFEANNEGLSSFHLNSELCEETLLLLQNILLSANCWLNTSFYKQIENEVVCSLQKLYLESLSPNVLKGKVDCRLELLKTMKVLQMNYHPLSPPPTQFSTEIFNMSLMDEDVNVIQEAKFSIVEMEKIIHPSAPTLNLPFAIN